MAARYFWGAMVVLLGMALSGCRGSATQGAEPASTMSASPDASGASVCPSREALESNPEGQRIPQDFRPQSWVLCTLVELDVTRGEAAGEHPELQAALSLQDQGGDGPCDARGILYPYLIAFDEHGRALHVHIPVDECYHTRPEVVEALGSIDWK